MNNATQAAFAAVLQTLKNNKVMVDTRKDGIYVRMAGKPENGECFTFEWGKVYSFDERLREDKSNTYYYAQRELDILVKSCPSDNRPIIEPFIPEILALCEKFGKSGQSGGSAPYTASAISQVVKKLMLQNPIMPMTGIDDEWVDVSGLGSKDEKECVYQNRRCSALFKNSEGRSWYLDAIVWKDENGSTWGGMAVMPDGSKIYGRQYVKSFPFTPKTFYIDIISEEVSPDDWTFHVKDEKQLKRVFKYYDRYK